MKDITNRYDIELLVDEFYKKVTQDDIVGFFFTDVVKLDWTKHIPVMYNFWETTLLGKIKCKGNPMLKQIALNQKQNMKTAHFERWLELWEKTIKDNFKGDKAEDAIRRAQQIGSLMKYKIEQVQN